LSPQTHDTSYVQVKMPGRRGRETAAAGARAARLARLGAPDHPERTVAGPVPPGFARAAG